MLTVAQEWTVKKMPDVLKPNKITVLRRQYIIVKVGCSASEEGVRNIKRDILEQLKDTGVAVVDGDVDIITVDADMLAVE